MVRECWDLSHITWVEQALSVASKELGRPVAEAELNSWLADEGKLEALFLGEIAEMRHRRSLIHR